MPSLLPARPRRCTPALRLPSRHARPVPRLTAPHESPGRRPGRSTAPRWYDRGGGDRAPGRRIPAPPRPGVAGVLPLSGSKGIAAPIGSHRVLRGRVERVPSGPIGSGRVVWMKRERGGGGRWVRRRTWWRALATRATMSRRNPLAWAMREFYLDVVKEWLTGETLLMRLMQQRGLCSTRFRITTAMSGGWRRRTTCTRRR